MNPRNGYMVGKKSAKNDLTNFWHQTKIST